MIQLLKRFEKYAPEKGTKGMPIATLQNFPEFIGNQLVNEILLLYIDASKQIIYPEQFLYLCGVLSPKTKVDKKRERKMFY